MLMLPPCVPGGAGGVLLPRAPAQAVAEDSQAIDPLVGAQRPQMRDLTL